MVSPGRTPDSDSDSEPFDLHAFRERIDEVRRNVLLDLDESALAPEVIPHVRLAMNALEAARIHVEAALAASSHRSPT